MLHISTKYLVVTQEEDRCIQITKVCNVAINFDQILTIFGMSNSARKCANALKIEKCIC